MAERENPERRAIREALERGLTVREVAALLRYSERTLYRRMVRFGLSARLAGMAAWQLANLAESAVTNADRGKAESVISDLPKPLGESDLPLTPTLPRRKLLGNEMSTALVQERRGRPRKETRTLLDYTWEVLEEKATEFSFLTGRKTTAEELAEIAITHGLPAIMREAGEKHAEDAAERLKRLLPKKGGDE